MIAGIDPKITIPSLPKAKPQNLLFGDPSMAMPDDITTLICLFHDDDQAQAAYKELKSAGFEAGAITVVGGKAPHAQPVSQAFLDTVGVPERDQEHLTEGLNEGGVLLAVSAFGAHQKQAEDIFTAHKAAKIDDVRTDDYANYKKYKPETQEQPTSVATPSSESEPVATVQDLLVEDEETDTAVPVRLVHIYRRSSEL